MFLVHDTINERHAYIERFLDCDDAPVSILLAAADFERCVRRAILGLGTSPTKVIREKHLGKDFHGPMAFKRAWKAEVKPRLGLNLANQVVRDWSRFDKAYRFRHKLIHGVTGRLESEFASGIARTIMQGASDIDDLARSEGVNLDRTIRRYKRWQP